MTERKMRVTAYSGKTYSVGMALYIKTSNKAVFEFKVNCINLPMKNGWKLKYKKQLHSCDN